MKHQPKAIDLNPSISIKKNIQTPMDPLRRSKQPVSIRPTHEPPHLHRCLITPSLLPLVILSWSKNKQPRAALTALAEPTKFDNSLTAMFFFPSSVHSNNERVSPYSSTTQQLRNHNRSLLLPTCVTSLSSTWRLLPPHDLQSPIPPLVPFLACDEQGTKDRTPQNQNWCSISPLLAMTLPFLLLPCVHMCLSIARSYIEHENEIKSPNFILDCKSRKHLVEDGGSGRWWHRNVVVENSGGDGWWSNNGGGEDVLEFMTCSSSLTMVSTDPKGRTNSGLAIDDGLWSSMRLKKGMWRSSGTAVGSVNASEKRASNVRESDGVCDGRCLAMSFDGEEAEEGITHSNCRYVDGGMLRQPTVLLPLLPPVR
ncbi:unnamed protein product [Lactuca saligna]|uniref:Uncharacterized protein n=1 Tax=Lactuca saligna TaxID=75948 RepID=A0AA35ZND4_LACSI|nr:unnamed protein product [Lactuca saligna]